jgi:hypothetical protein
VACVLGTLALATAGCGAETHPNDPRTQAPTRISVTIGDHAVSVQPAAVGLGPDRTQVIPQNQHSAQPPIQTKDPLIVVFVAANLTDFDSHLEIHGPKNVSSGQVFANSTATLQTELPTGVYRIGAADIPGAKAAQLTVGPYRASSQNDVLLP